MLDSHCLWLLESPVMANWRQIHGRIRRAKSSPNAQAKLAELYAKTRDAMVAFELGAVEEKAAHNDEAVRWYTTAAERFRRADWKKKAADALERLGAPVPVESVAPQTVPAAHEPNGDATEEFRAIETTIAATPEAEEAVINVAAELRSAEPAPASTAPSESEIPHKRRRRGRRGGRGRRKHREGAPAAAASSAMQAATSPAEPHEAPAAVAPVVERAAPAVVEEPTLPSERIAHGRGAEPAIASRLVKLESLLRRLLGSQLHKLDEIDDAPAGPGVFILSDSDLITSYYVEACKTLRVGIGQVLRSQRGGRGQAGGSFRARLAEHLEISESKVSDYLKKHCVVRWLQLDEDAGYLAHFAIGVLKTPLNVD